MKTMKTTGDQQLVKRINRSVLLRLLRRQGGQSRAQLASASGLTKSTVSLLVRELLEEGWLTESSTSAALGLGRPSTPLCIDDRNRAMVGVELAVEALRVVAVSLTGKVLLSEEQVLVSLDPEAVCRQLAQMVAGVYATLVQDGMQLSGVGVGVPGAFDQVTGLLHLAPNLGWRNIDLLPLVVEALREQGVPPVAVHLQNEADAAAFSEYEFSGAEVTDSLIFVACGAGVGAGIVLNDRLFTGTHGMAGEVGHSILQIDGALCSCGRRGCAETFFGARALAQLDDPAQGGRYLGVVLQNLWTTFNPDVLVVGGPSQQRYPAMLAVAKDTLRAYADCIGMEPPDVRPARYGLMAAAVGAAAMVLHHDLRPLHPGAASASSRPDGVEDSPSSECISA